MTDFDPIAFGQKMGALVKAQTEPLIQRIADLEGRCKALSDELAKPIEVSIPTAEEVVSILLDSGRVDTLCDLKATEAVAKHMADNPVRDGKDGAGVADLLIDRAGELVATMTDGRMKNLGPVVGKDGDPGKEGADFTDVAIEYDGERKITVRGKGGEIVKTVPIPLDRGYYRDGMAVEKGDILTHDGNAWIALRETKAKPCHENKDDWRLFARRGRDGKDGQKVYVEPKPVKLGADNAA